MVVFFCAFLESVKSSSGIILAFIIVVNHITWWQFAPLHCAEFLSRMHTFKFVRNKKSRCVSGDIHWCYYDVTWTAWRLKSPATPLFVRLFVRVRIKENSKLRVTGLCEENPPITGEFPAQKASNAENGSISWRQHASVLWYHTFWWLLLTRNNFDHSMDK